MKEVRAQAKEMQRRISLVKSSLPCSYGFSADELVDAVMALGTVTGEDALSQGSRQHMPQHHHLVCSSRVHSCIVRFKGGCGEWSGCDLVPASCAGLKPLESTDNRRETVKALQWYEEQLRNRCTPGTPGLWSHLVTGLRRLFIYLRCSEQAPAGCRLQGSVCVCMVIVGTHGPIDASLLLDMWWTHTSCFCCTTVPVQSAVQDACYSE